MNSADDPLQWLFNQLGSLTEFEKAEIRAHQDFVVTRRQLAPKAEWDDRIAEIEANRKLRLDELDRFSAASVTESSTPEQANQRQAEFDKLRAQVNRNHDKQLATMIKAMNLVIREKPQS